MLTIAHIVRYADDFVILCSRQPEFYLEQARAVLDRLGLTLNGKKRRIDLWAPFVAVSSSVNTTGQAAGCAVDVWRRSPFWTGTDIVTGDPLSNVFSGFEVDIAVFGAAILDRLSYEISLVGRIGFLA